MASPPDDELECTGQPPWSLSVIITVVTTERSNRQDVMRPTRLLLGMRIAVAIFAPFASKFTSNLWLSFESCMYYMLPRNCVGRK